MNEEIKTYPSKKDGWIVGILFGVPVALILHGAAWSLQESVANGMITILIGVLTGAMIVLLAFPCRYTLTKDSLTIECGMAGMYTEKIELRSVKEIRKTKMWWAAPALSLKRVELVTENGTTIISPVDRDGFIVDIEARRSKPMSG